MSKTEDLKKLLGFISKSRPSNVNRCIAVNRNFSTVYLSTITPQQNKKFESLLVKCLDPTQKFSIKYLRDFFIDYYIQNNEIDLNDILLELSKIEKIKKTTYIGLKDIIVDVPCDFGCFKILSKSEFENVLKQVYQKTYAEDAINKLFDSEEKFLNFFIESKAYSDSVVEIELEAYDENNIIELARNKFEEFDKLLSFSCYPFAKRQIASIFAPNHNEEELLSTDGVYWSKYSSLSNKAILSTTKTSTIKNIMAQMGTDFIWNLYSKENKNEIEKRIVSAALWIGMANNEEDCNVSFIEYCFALETLLQHDTGKLLSLGIGYSISETAALIISNEFKERKSIKEQINNFYSLRSAIVHGGRKKASADDATEILIVVMRLIICLYHNKWTELQNMDKLDEKIENIKPGN